MLCQRVNELHARDGGVSPYTVYEDAHDPSSPLHRLFDWDDSSAANKFRLIQAGHYLRSVMLVVKVEEVTGEAKLARGFHPIVTPQGRVYHPITNISRSEMHSNLLLTQFHQDAMRFIARYENLREALPLIRAMREWLKTLTVRPGDTT